MKLAFYKAFQEKATFKDKLIAFLTLGSYSHVELMLSTTEGYSISQGGFTRIQEIQFNSNEWEFVELNLTLNEQKKLIDRAVESLGKKYDYVGAFFSAFGFCEDSKKKVFCSEEIANQLHHAKAYGSLKEGCVYSPNALYKKIKMINYENEVT